MKKFLIISALCFSLFVGVSTWILTDTKLQTDITNSLLKSSEASVENVKISIGKIEAENFSLMLKDGLLTAEKLELEFSPVSLLAIKLSGKGSITGVVFDIKDKQSTNGENHSQEKTNAKKEDGSNGFQLPINLDISSFGISGKIIKNNRHATFETSIKNLKISKKQSLFDATTRLEIGDTYYTSNIKKTKKDFIAKVFNKENEILLIDADSKDFLTGNVKTKLTLSPATIAPIANTFNLEFPSIDAQIYTDGIFDFQTNKYCANIIAKAEISQLNKFGKTKNIPCKKLSLELQTNFELSPESLKIAQLESFASADDYPVLKINRDNSLSLNLKNTTDEQWIDLCDAQISIPAKFADAFVKNASFSAENIGGIFKIRANKKYQFEISTVKPANILNAKLEKDNSTIFESLTLLFEGKSQIDTTNNYYKFDAELKSPELGDKQFIAKIKAEKNQKTSLCAIEINGSLSPILSRINSVSANTELNVASTITASIENANLIKISQLDAKITSDTSKNQLLISATKPISYNNNSNEFTTPSSIKIYTKDFPFAPLRPLFTSVDAQSISIDTHTVFSGKEIENKGACSISDISYKNKNAREIDDINFATNFTVSTNLGTKSLSFNAENINISNSATILCTGTTTLVANYKNSFNLENIKSKLDLRLPQIFALPILSKYNNIARASASATLELNNKNEIIADVKMTNIASKTISEDIDLLHLKLSTKENASTRNISSDLEINTVRGKTKARASINKNEKISAEIVAENIILDDINILKSAFSPPSISEKQSENTDISQTKFIPQPKDTKAFWDAGTDVSVKTKISTLKLDDNSALENFSASLYLNEENLKISDISAKILDGKLSGNLEINFNKTTPKPYHITPSLIKLENFDISKISNKKFLTGTFSAEVELSGNGNNLKDLTKYLTGKATIQARNGTIAMINTDIDIGQKIALTQSMAKLTNKILKNKIVDTSLLLLEKFSKIDFNDAKFILSRNDKDFNVNVDFGEINALDMSFKTQKGVIYFSPDKNFLQQDVEIDVVIYTDNLVLATMLNSVQALDAISNLSGYKKSETFKIYGTLENPRTNFIDILSGKRASSIPTKFFNKLNLFK